MPNFHRKDGITLTEESLAEGIAKYAKKFLWFAKAGYKPHYWQLLFHINSNPKTDRLCRFRHLVAGRRGGKTLSAAWEVVFYALNPEAYWEDFKGTKSDKPLLIWVVTQDYPMGLWALLAVRDALKTAGCEEGKEYKENRGNRWIEFENGTFLLFKTAENPNKLRGAGVDIMWYDEAAIIPNEEAWQISSPAISDREGAFISTTTPDGKNWFYNEFWSTEKLGLPHHGRIEYWSIDNPYFAKSEWERLKSEYHPIIFKREFMASFDALAGKELSGDWLHYYTQAELDTYLVNGKFQGNIFVAVDPAISLADSADRFAITAIGVTKDRTQAFLLEQWAGRIPFPEQVDKINLWFQKYRPWGIAIEKTAYQAALVQQVQRLEGMPPVIPLFTRGKKSERILSMAPLFRTGRIKISKDHADFIGEWVDYDSTKKNPHDDCLDSMEMAIRAAGILLPGNPMPEEEQFGLAYAATTTSMWDQLASDARKKYSETTGDEHLGTEW